MCTDYELNLEFPPFFLELKETGIFPLVHWMGRLPGNARPTPHVRISDRGIVICRGKDGARPEWMPWAWEERDERVFNVKSERRVFANSKRCLILATGFYEYTIPAEPKGKLFDQHIVRWKGQRWFWMAGIVKQGFFAVITTRAGDDVRSLNGRQPCLLEPAAGKSWLDLKEPAASLLKPSPAGSLEITTLRKDCPLRRDAQSAA